MPNLVVLCPTPNDATSFYRGMGPLGTLKRQIPELNLIFTNEFNWSSLKLADALFVQRPFVDQHVKLIEVAKNNGVPVWVDYDDDLFSVPTDNPTHGVYGQESIQKNVAKCLAMATVITCTNEVLRRKFLPANPNVVVIPNAFDDELFGDALGGRPKLNSPRKPLVCWRGSNTHMRDVMSFATEIVELSHQFPRWTWNFVGYNPWFVTDVMPNKNTVVTPAMDVVEYHKFLATIQPAVQIVPLANNEFNRSKSNIAFIEACYAGGVALGPKWETWENPGVITYENPDDFRKKLEGLLKGEFDLERISREGWEFVQQNLRLSQVNKLRHAVLQELMDSRRTAGRLPVLRVSCHE